MKLTNPANVGADLTGSEVYLDVTDPDGVTVTIGPFATNENGQVTVTSIGLPGNGLLSDGGDISFNKKGTWSLIARFTGTAALLASTSSAQLLLVGTSAGYAVLVQGKISNNEGLASHNKTANRIYRTLRSRGFDDQSIFYINHDPAQDANQDGVPDNAITQLGVGVDFSPSEAGVREVIEGLAAVVNDNPAPIYLLFVEHGAPAPSFLLGGGETITPAELDGWLDTLEAGLDTEARKEPRVVVVGTCYSGGFISRLSGPNRLIVASAAADEESYKGPQEADGIRVGEYFLEEFFQELGRGTDFSASFTAATAKTENYTRTGGISTNSANQYFDSAEQHPLLDDNGDGAGSNVLDAASGDGALAASLFLGTGPNHDTNSADNPADIAGVTTTLFLSNAQSQAALELFANDTAQVSQAYVEIRAPATQLAPEGGTEQLETNYTRRQLLPPGNPHGDRFYLLADGFTAPGKYEIYYYVQDVETGALSPARRSVVYKNLGTNAPPAAFDLLSPLAGATVKTVGIFDWEDITGPDGHDLSHTLVITDDAGFTTFNGAAGAYRLEELPSSAAAVDATAGLRDLSTYHWKVEAVDVFGAIRASSQTRSFSTDNGNAPFGILKGIVHGDLDFARLAGSSVRGVVGSVSETVVAEVNGEYVLLMPPGSARVTGSRSGYLSRVFTGIDVPVSTTDEPYVSLNLPLLPNNADSDGDGMTNSWEVAHGLGPENPNDVALDPDGDADGDGLTNGREAALGTDPFKADTDGDGLNDRKELALGRDPTVNEAAAIVPVIIMLLDNGP